MIRLLMPQGAWPNLHGTHTKTNKQKQWNDYHHLETFLNYVKDFAKALQQQSRSSRTAANLAKAAKELVKVC